MVTKEGRPDYEYYCEQVTVMRIMWAYSKLPLLVRTIKTETLAENNCRHHFKTKGNPKYKALEASLLQTA